MKASTRWRRTLLRLVWTVPLAFAVVSAFAFTGVLDCFTSGGYPSPGGSPCQSNWAPYYGGSDAWTLRDGNNEFEDDITIYGYRIDTGCNPGVKWGMETVWAQTIGQESCVGTSVKTKWNESGNSPDGTVPWTLVGWGGHVTPGSGCFGGDWVTASVQGTVADLVTGTNNNDVGSDYHCQIIVPITLPGAGTPPGC